MDKVVTKPCPKGFIRFDDVLVHVASIRDVEKLGSDGTYRERTRFTNEDRQVTDISVAFDEAVQIMIDALGPQHQ